MFDSYVYLPSASSTESCDTSHSSDKEEMDVATTVPPYEGQPRASNEDFYEVWLKDGFSSALFKSRLEQKNSRYWMFSLLLLCFVSYGEIYGKNG